MDADPAPLAASWPPGLTEGARVVVAMSGGVDSSTAAAILKAQGFDVVGVTLKLYNASGTSASLGGRCCSPRDIEDARATAAQLGIPHYVLDHVAEFQEAVIDDFVAEHRLARTPNPCVRCNERIKFGPLLRFADAIGGAVLATGHYARLEAAGAGMPRRLRRAVDGDKDQAYFLFGVQPRLFDRIMFPLGGLTKPQVRAWAARARLPNADKPDSQQLCFIPDGDHRAFVEARGGAGRAGILVDEGGQTMGSHGGTHHFTIGQRKGIPARDGRPRFVVRIDPTTGTVFTGPRERVGRTEVHAEDVRWFCAPLESGTSRRARVQIRHHADAHPAMIRKPLDEEKGEPGLVHITFDHPVDGVAPGQAAVFYDEDQLVLGGGWLAVPEDRHASQSKSAAGSTLTPHASGLLGA